VHVPLALSAQPLLSAERHTLTVPSRHARPRGLHQPTEAHRRLLRCRTMTSSPPSVHAAAGCSRSVDHQFRTAHAERQRETIAPRIDEPRGACVVQHSRILHAGEFDRHRAAALAARSRSGTVLMITGLVMTLNQKALQQRSGAHRAYSHPRPANRMIRCNALRPM